MKKVIINLENLGVYLKFIEGFRLYGWEVIIR